MTCIYYCYHLRDNCHTDSEGLNRLVQKSLRIKVNRELIVIHLHSQHIMIITLFSDC